MALLFLVAIRLLLYAGLNTWLAVGYTWSCGHAGNVARGLLVLGLLVFCCLYCLFINDIRVGDYEHGPLASDSELNEGSSSTCSCDVRGFGYVCMLFVRAGVDAGDPCSISIPDAA